jgi:2-iminobutanoate/2-iminopropanoate deaminase
MRRREFAVKEIVEVPVLSAAVRKIGLPLSLVTKGGGLVFVSGTPPLDIATGGLVRGDIEIQTEASLRAVKHCLAAAGTSTDNILMVRIYAANTGFYNAINRVYARHFPDNPPARTFVPVASWPMEFDLEVEAVAIA